MPTLELYRLPQHAPSERLRDTTVIVVDLLRASTTICTALAAGAECVMPFVGIDETLAAAARFGRGNVVLGGERHGELIPGFDLGNSPAEYTAEGVAGRRVLFSTTNGARAIRHVANASRVLIGAAVNRAAVARAVYDSRPAAILCAGTDGEPGLDDMLAGGAIIEAMVAQPVAWSLSDSASSALGLWRPLANIAARNQRTIDAVLTEMLRNCTDGAANLVAIGHDADIAHCARLDLLTIVPELNRATGEIRPA